MGILASALLVRPLRPSLACAAGLAALLAVGAARGQSDDIAEQRRLFERGMARFKEGKYYEAIGVWGPIADRLGDSRGYRLLYNLGVAYDELGDATSAADRLERFLAQAAARPSADRPAEVIEFEADAQRRLASLKGRYARVRVSSPGREVLSLGIDGAPPRVVPSGTILYLLPGRHALLLRAGTADEEPRSVDAARGEQIDIAASPLPSPSASASALSPATSAPPPALPPSRPPFSPVWLGVAAGVTAAGVALPLYLRYDALDIKRVYDDPRTTVTRQRDLFDEYQSARRRYELSWLLPSALAVGTGVLAAVYLLSPRGGPEQGVRVGLWGRGLVIEGELR